jgi:uncharacterized protein (TIGR00255 family)
MTGFGVGDVALPHGRVIAEIRSVNQRFLDVRARLPRELSDLSLFAEQVARERLRRGRVELLVHTEGTVLSPCTLDKARARAAVAALAELRDELAPGAEVPLSLLSVVPDLFTPPAGAEIDVLRRSVKLAVERAVSAMEAMCHREGDALAADLRARCQLLRELLADVARLAEGCREGMRRRLRERVERLFTDLESDLRELRDPRWPSPPFDHARIEAEVALLADRSDFAEELTRLSSHLDQFSGALDEETPPAPAVRSSAPSDPPGTSTSAAESAPTPMPPRPRTEPVGRRLDFLLQEMLREANTLGAKAQDATLAQRVVAIKVELERLREQVQNIE